MEYQEQQNQGFPESQAPSNYMVFSIINIGLSVINLCCGLGIISGPFAILAVMKSSDVNQCMQVGNSLGARLASEKSKMYNIIAIIINGISLIIGLILMFFSSLPILLLPLGI